MIVLEIKNYLIKLRINNFLENPRKHKNFYVTVRNAGYADIRTHIHTHTHTHIHTTHENQNSVMFIHLIVIIILFV